MGVFEQTQLAPVNRDVNVRVKRTADLLEDITYHRAMRFPISLRQRVGLSARPKFVGCDDFPSLPVLCARLKTSGEVLMPRYFFT